MEAPIMPYDVPVPPTIESMLPELISAEKDSLVISLLDHIDELTAERAFYASPTEYIADMICLIIGFALIALVIVGTVRGILVIVRTIASWISKMRNRRKASRAFRSASEKEAIGRIEKAVNDIPDGIADKIKDAIREAAGHISEPYEPYFTLPEADNCICVNGMPFAGGAYEMFPPSAEEDTQHAAARDLYLMLFHSYLLENKIYREYTRYREAWEWMLMRLKGKGPYGIGSKGIEKYAEEIAAMKYGRTVGNADNALILAVSLDADSVISSGMLYHASSYLMDYLSRKLGKDAEAEPAADAADEPDLLSVILDDSLDKEE